LLAGYFVITQNYLYCMHPVRPSRAGQVGLCFILARLDAGNPHDPFRHAQIVSCQTKRRANGQSNPVAPISS
jgi:hypothetical protein